MKVGGRASYSYRGKAVLRDPVGAGWSANLLGRSMPRHEFVDAEVATNRRQRGQHVGEVALRIDQTQLAGLDERHHAGPTSAPSSLLQRDCSSLIVLQASLESAIKSRQHKRCHC